MDANRTEMNPTEFESILKTHTVKIDIDFDGVVDSEQGTGTIYKAKDGPLLIITARHCLQGMNFDKSLSSICKITANQTFEKKVASWLPEEFEVLVDKTEDLAIIVVESKAKSQFGDVLTWSIGVGEFDTNSEHAGYGYQDMLKSSGAQKHTWKKVQDVDHNPHLLEFECLSPLSPREGSLATEYLGGYSGTGLFLKDSNHLCSLAVELVDETGIHDRIVVVKANLVNPLLDSKGIKRIEEVNLGLPSKKWTESILQKFEDASYQLADCNDSFDGIDDSHIERKETQEVLNWIDSALKPKEEPVTLLVGGAGSGKTVILKDVLLELRSRDIPVIGIKADRYYADSIQELEVKTDIRDGIENAIRTLSKDNERVVVLIDQIDALSQSLSAKREYLDTYNQLIRKLIRIDRVRVVISVRAYDLHYDNDLRFYENQKAINVGLLESDEVIKILDKLGIKGASISGQLLSLLQTPHHLNVFCKVYDAQTNLLSIKTLHDLYNSLWLSRVVKVPVTSSASPEKCQSLVFSIACKMHKVQQIVMPLGSTIADFSDELEYLKSVGILTSSKNLIQFFHQTFFDYTFARQFVESNRSITKYLLENHQGLFVRSSLKMVLAFLREQNEQQYITALKTILLSKKYKFHIKLMLLNLLGFEENPTEREKGFAMSKLLVSKDLRLPFLESINSSGWVEYLIDSGEISAILTLGPSWYDLLLGRNWGKLAGLNTSIKRFFGYKEWVDQKQENTNICFQILVRSLPKSRKAVCKFLIVSTEFEGKNKFVFSFLYHLEAWDIAEAFQLFEKYEDQIQDQFSYLKVLQDAINFDLEWVLTKYKLHFHEKVDAIIEFNDRPHFEYQEVELLKKIVEIDGVKAFEFLLELLFLISDKTSGDDKSTPYQDWAFVFYDHQEEKNSYGYEAIYSLLITQVQLFARQMDPLFMTFFNDHKNSRSMTILRLIFFGFLENASKYVQWIFEYMTLFHANVGLEIEFTAHFQFRQLLKLAYPHFTSAQKQEIDNMLLSISSKEELRTYSDQNGIKRSNLRSYGRHKYLYLSSIPENELMARSKLKGPFLELQRKFTAIEDKVPNRIRAYAIGPPMDGSAYSKMTHEQWETTFKKYDESYKPGFGSEKGNILEHSRQFQAEVKAKPEYFSSFIERLVIENSVPHAYLIAGIEGLKEGGYDPNVVLRIYSSALKLRFDRPNTLYLVWISSYFIKNRNMNAEVLEYLIHLAKTHPDPVGNEIRNNPLMDGGDNVRGAAAGRISEVFFRPDFEETIFEALDVIAEDQNLSVQVAIIAHFPNLVHLNSDKFLSLFLKLVRRNEPELMEYSWIPVQHLARSHFDALSTYFENAIHLESIQGNVAIILLLAWLRGENGSHDHLEKLLKISDKAKGEAITASIKNLNDENLEVRQKCQSIFRRFLNSSSEIVIDKYFYGFREFKAEMFVDLFPLLIVYAESNVSKKMSPYYFEYLLKCTKLYPQQCIELLEKLDKESKTQDYSEMFQGDKPLKVLLGAYNSLASLPVQDMKYLERCIDLFDIMLKNPRFRGHAEKVIEEI